MGTSSSSPKTSTNGKPETNGQDQIAALVARIAEELRGRNDDSGRDDDVILDLTTDGVRCLILRSEEPSAAAQPPRLSPREREIARMVALGYPNKTIAAVLDISTWTVGSHLRRIFAKLQVPSRAAMVARLSDRRSPR